MPNRRSSRRSDRGPGWLLAALALVAPLARGGVDLWVVAIFAVIAVIAALWSRAHAHVPWTVGPVLLALLLMLFQLAPVPPWAHHLSPGARSVYEFALAPLGFYPSWRPFSLAPGEGLRSLSHGIAIVAAFLTARSVGESGSGRRRLAIAIALSGVVASVAVLFLALSGLGSFIEPHLPFVNPNHLAALTGFGAVTAVGIAFGELRTARLLWFATGGVAAATTLLTLSRSGLVALSSGLVVLFVLHQRARGEDLPELPPRPRSLVRRFAPAIAGIAGVVIAVALLAYEPVTGELRSFGAFAGDAKPRLWLAGVSMLWPHALVGMGRGAFATVSSAYWLEPARYTYTHVENTWLQLLLDLGLPVGGLLLAGFAWTWFSAARNSKRGSSDVALLAGLASLFVHDLADFSLETLGVALPAAMALGLLARRVRSYSVPPWAFHLVGVLAGVGAVASSLAYERTVVPAQLAVVPAAAPTDPRPAAARAMRFAPADYVIPSNTGAILEARGECRQAMPWLTSATYLNPSAPEPHLLLARCLRAGGRVELARQESVLAIALGDPRGYDEAIASYPSLADLLRAVPSTPDHLLALADHLARPRPADAASVLRSVLDDYLDDRALLPLARAELALKNPTSARELARQAQGLRAPSLDAWYVAYVARVEQGDVDGGMEELRAGVARFPGSTQLLAPLVERALSFQRYAEARRLTEEIGPSSSGEAANKYLLLARVYAAQGRFSEAMQEDRAAVAAMPEWPGPLLQLAGHALNANHYADAVAALEQACPMPGHDTGACARQLARARELESADEAAARQKALDRLVEPR